MESFELTMHKMPFVYYATSIIIIFKYPENCLDSLFTVISFLKVIDLGMVVCLKGNFLKCCALVRIRKSLKTIKKKRHVEIVIYILVISVALDICKDYRD